MNCRPSLIFCLLLALLGLGLADVSGPDPAGQPARHAPVLVAGKVSPSPQTSPGVVQNIAVDSLGAVAATLYAGGAEIGNGNGINVQGGHAHDQGDGGNPVKVGGYAHATGSLPTAVSANGDRANLLVDRYGRARVSLESTTGGSVIDAGGLFVQANDTAQAVGHSVAYETQCAGGTAESTAKASGGLLKWVHISNPNTTDAFFQAFDASNPTPGSTTPLLSLCIPGGTGASNRGVYNQEFGPVGVTFSTAITYTITTTAAGGTAPAANCTVSIGYK